MEHPRVAMVVIQSRLASTRLPAKALLPVGGRTAVVLCAQRAANTGLPVVVATSDATDDDAIAEVLAAAKINCIRGPLDDVLLRYVQATETLPDDAAVVRLTADNLFPDGAFVADLLSQFQRSGLEYMGTKSPQDGLPYGMSAEVFTAAALRKANRETRSASDREHVTPWIRRNCRAGRYQGQRVEPHWSRLRCTLDTYADYRVVREVFAGCREPVGATWIELTEKLASLSPHGHEPRCPFRDRPDGTAHSVLTLGTAQFGSSYGIANRVGEPSDAEIKEMLLEAADAGVTSIDTASAYGKSEERIGRLLPPRFIDGIRIVTKLDVLADLPAEASPETVAARVDLSVHKSLYLLKRTRLDGLLLHRWAHRLAWSGALWNRLLEHQRSGLIDTLGASVANPTEAVQALADPDVRHLQCPVNIVDARWRSAEFLQAVKRRPDVVIHARSVLLQGLLTLPAQDWVPSGQFEARDLCDTLDGLARSLGRAGRADLCIGYVRSLPWVTSLVIGMETRAQLRTNLELLQTPVMSEEQMQVVDAAIPALPETLLNPALWPVARG